MVLSKWVVISSMPLSGVKEASIESCKAKFRMELPFLMETRFEKTNKIKIYLSNIFQYYN